MSGESYPLSAPPSSKSFPVHVLWRGREGDPDFQWPLVMQLLKPLDEEPWELMLPAPFVLVPLSALPVSHSALPLADPLVPDVTPPVTLVWILKRCAQVGWR